MVKLANPDICSGCGACAYRCPQRCITMEENSIGIVLPHIDEKSCKDCHACEKVCPMLHEVQSNQSKKAYAAWSLDKEERRTSASGGIGAEMYKMAIIMGYKIIGAVQQEDFSVKHKMSESADAISCFKNSKYVFSSAYDVFPQIEDALQASRKVLFIGLPCQVAAMRKLYKNDDNLLLVEVVCHGTSPVSYLRQHIDMLNRQTGNVAKWMSFRDSCSFIFALYNSEGSRFYAKQTKDGDTYQFGYHRAVSYRENCYHCPFAKPERNANITIADYHGLGLVRPVTFSAGDVSLILVNDEKGQRFVDALMQGGYIFAEERPLEEPFKGDAQLRHPSLKNKYRIQFEKCIREECGNFERAILHPHKNFMRSEMLNRIKEISKHAVRKIIKLIGIQ